MPISSVTSAENQLEASAKCSQVAQSEPGAVALLLSCSTRADWRSTSRDAIMI